MQILTLDEQTRKNILENLLQRSPSNYGEFETRVSTIVENVKANGDAALFDYTRQFDGADISADNLIVTDAEIKEAYAEVSAELLDVMRKALKNIREFHQMKILILNTVIRIMVLRRFLIIYQKN